MKLWLAVILAYLAGIATRRVVAHLVRKRRDRAELRELFRSIERAERR